jgi:hypothetical protein
VTPAKTTATRQPENARGSAPLTVERRNTQRSGGTRVATAEERAGREWRLIGRVMNACCPAEFRETMHTMDKLVAVGSRPESEARDREMRRLVEEIGQIIDRAREKVEAMTKAKSKSRR